MDCHTRRTHGPWGAPLAITVIALILSAAAGRMANAAQDDEDTDHEVRGVQHVRTVDGTPSALIAEGVRRSPTFRTLLARLNRSRVIAYLEHRVLPSNLTGRLTFVGMGQPWRYLRIEIECRQSTVSQIAALGHELQHALEIAGEPAAVDQQSIRALYGTIGFPVDHSQRRFESHAARDAGNRVRRELSEPAIELARTTTYVLP